jgi:hypothetical protein
MFQNKKHVNLKGRRRRKRQMKNGTYNLSVFEFPAALSGNPSAVEFDLDAKMSMQQENASNKASNISKARRQRATGDPVTRCCSKLLR